jgi:uncharacterized membrane protein YdbT with pleckstrin-like domain
MSYIKQILLPEEHILYDGRVHPRVLMPGVMLLGVAACMLLLSAHTGRGHSWLLSFVYYLGQEFRPFYKLYSMLYQWQRHNPSIALEIKVTALGIALWGFSLFMNALMLIQSTELLVTDQRVIAKVGIMSATTVELDRRRISGVVVEQSVMGRIMGYGHVHIQGFTTSIGGLPIMVNPHLIEKFVM